jgi:hypothetical protein
MLGMTPALVNGLDSPRIPAFVTVGGARYSIQWGPLTEIVLSSRGYTTSTVLDIINKQDPRSSAVIVELIAAFTAHNFRATEAPSTREWAARLLPGELADAFQQVRLCLFEAGIWRPLEKNAPKPESKPATPAPLAISQPQ